jgi:hypothetical protein
LSAALLLMLIGLKSNRLAHTITGQSFRSGP